MERQSDGTGGHHEWVERQSDSTGGHHEWVERQSDGTGGHHEWVERQFVQSALIINLLVVTIIVTVAILPGH